MIYSVSARTYLIGIRAGQLLTGRLKEERAQGTVEYVALILLVGAVLAGVVAATKGKQFGASGIAEAIVKQMKKALDTVQ
jgi:hypothetical protein